MRKTRYQTKVRDTRHQVKQLWMKVSIDRHLLPRGLSMISTMSRKKGRSCFRSTRRKERHSWLHSSASSIRSCHDWGTTVSWNHRIMNILILPVTKDLWTTEMKQHQKSFHFVTVCDFPEGCHFKVSSLQCNSHSEILRLEQQRCQVCFHHLSSISSLWFLTSSLDSKLAVSMTLPDNLAPFPCDFVFFSKMFLNFS